MANTSRGFPYPAATDPVQAGAAAIQALAAAVDAKLSIAGRIAAGGTIAGGTGFTVVKNSAGVYTVTFTTPFPTIPAVITTLIYTATGGSFRTPFVVNPSVSSFQVVLQDAAGTAFDYAVAFHAIALP